MSKMKQVVLNIPDNEYQFFMKVIKNFPFVKIDEKKNRLLEQEEKLSTSKRKIWANIKEGLNEVVLIQQGEIREKTAKEFLCEL